MSVDGSGQIATGRYFTFPRNRPPDLAGQAATRRWMPPSHPRSGGRWSAMCRVGVLLSGGIDSPLVAAAMRQATAASLPAFTLGTNGDEHDESRDASRTPAR